jgi:hypothetical protein
MVAALDADHETRFNFIVERQLVFDNLLGKFHPLIAYIVVCIYMYIYTYVYAHLCQYMFTFYACDNCYVNVYNVYICIHIYI